jgi:voltage-gated potassium channel
MVSRVPLFATMNEAEIAEITKLVYTRSYLPGEPIVRATDAGESMFLLAGGEATVEMGRGRRTTLKEGDFFGEMALLEHRRHKHDVIAKTRCRVYVLDSQAFARLSRRHPEIIRRIREVAEERAKADRARPPRKVARKTKTKARRS